MSGKFPDRTYRCIATEGASPHLKDELPAEMTRLNDAMSLGGCYELGDALERRPGAPDCRSQRGHVSAVGLRRLHAGPMKAARPCWR